MASPGVRFKSPNVRLASQANRFVLLLPLRAPPVFTRAELIMAVGLVVDYMVHIIHYFLHQVLLHNCIAANYMVK